MSRTKEEKLQRKRLLAREWMRAYRKANPEKQKALRRARYLANPEKYKARQRADYRAHQKEYAAKQLAVHRANPEKYRTRNREWMRADYRANREAYRKKQNEDYRANPERHRAYNRTAYQANPEMYKAKARERVQACRRADLEKWRERNRIGQQKWGRKHLEQKREQLRRYRARKRKAPGAHTMKQWMARVEFYGWRCVYCGKKLTKRTLTQDHVIPLSKGGSHFASNLVPACHPCNSGKCNRTGRSYKPA